MAKRLLCLALVLMLALPVYAAETEERFTLSFVGDCTFGGTSATFNARQGFVKLVGEDYEYPFRQVAEYFREDEATFLNLEGPLCDTEYAMQKTYAFRCPTAFVSILTENSIEAVSVANNHTKDQGLQGYTSTLEVLKAQDIPCAKALEGTLFTTENGLAIGLYGATYENMDEEAILAGIRELAEQEPDILIFAPHWGYEGSYRPNAQQLSLGRAAIDAGADIVWGSHPHVLQPVERYNGGVICYSLGNFSFGGNGGPTDWDTAIVQQEVIRSRDGSITLGETRFVPCRLSGNRYYNDFQPYPYEEGTREYDRTMEKLTGTWYLSHNS